LYSTKDIGGGARVIFFPMPEPEIEKNIREELLTFQLFKKLY
jgi:hypothetical protein